MISLPARTLYLTAKLWLPDASGTDGLLDVSGKETTPAGIAEALRPLQDHPHPLSFRYVEAMEWLRHEILADAEDRKRAMDEKSKLEARDIRKSRRASGRGHCLGDQNAIWPG